MTRTGLDIADIVDLDTPIAQAGSLAVQGCIAADTIDGDLSVVALIYASTHGG